MLPDHRPLALLALLVAPIFPVAQEGEPAPAAAPAEGADGAEPTSPSDAEILGPTLVVNGDEVSMLELKRAIVSGPLGRQFLESAKIQVFIDEEIDRLVKEGAPRERFLVGDEEIDAAIREADEHVRREFPGGEFKNAIDLMPIPEEAWRDQFRQTQLFDRVFLPENPNEYPETTRRALEKQSPDFVQRLIEGYEMRQASGEQPQADQQNLFQQFLRQMVMAALSKEATIETPLEGIPPEHALVVNGRPILTEDVWRVVRHRVTPTAVHQSKLWLAKTKAAEDALREKGAWPTDEEFEEAYHEHTDPYADSPFSIPAVAVSFKKFPSEAHYKRYYRIEQGFRRLIADKLGDDYLQAHVEARAQNMLGLAKADVEVILCSAFDFLRATFLPGGWKEAEEEAVQVVKELADGRPWDEVLDEHSDFFTPPLGRSNAGMQATVDLKKGRFGPMNRNELLQKLGESDFSIFLNGWSLTDAIFFEAEAGVPTQPMKGPFGYYVALVKQRTAPISKIDIAGPPEKNHRILVEQDYVATRLAAFAQEALEEADVQGLSLD